MPWQQDLARPELSAGCSHCVFENLHSHLCYCLGGRPPGSLPSSLCPAPSSGFLPQEHAFLCALLDGGQDPLHPHQRRGVLPTGSLAHGAKPEPRSPPALDHPLLPRVCTPTTNAALRRMDLERALKDLGNGLVQGTTY